MTWMNEYDIEDALRYTAIHELPNLRRGAEILSRLKDWTNNNSDGWPYWQKPSNAATKLMGYLEAARRNYDGEDISERDLRDALSPVKAFLTRQGVDHAKILDDPPPPLIPVHIVAHPVHTDEGATFTPWSDGRCVGYKVTAEGKPDMYVYFNPSGAQDTGKLDDTDVFVYRGGDGDPSMDDTDCYINVWEGE